MPIPTTQTYIELSEKFLEVAHALATGPNKYKSLFGKILEGVFRKDYFTLQTITLLAKWAEKDKGLQIVFGGSVLDLSRRVFEDMVYMEYISKKGKEKYSKRFIQHAAVDQKNDMEFLLASDVSVDKKLMTSTNEDYQKVPKDLRGRKNWAGQDIESIIGFLVSQRIIVESEKETLLKIYVAGNRKNHTSPGDIMDHSNEKRITNASEKDIHLGLMITLGAVVKVALRLVEETKSSKEMKDAIQGIWDKIASL